MAVSSYAFLLARAGVLVATASSPATPAEAPSRCPTAEGLWSELTKLVGPQALSARDPPLDAAAVPIADLGSRFRISVLGKTREYRDESRDCARRARMGALFVALVVDPGDSNNGGNLPGSSPEAGPPPAPEARPASSSPELRGPAPPGAPAPQDQQRPPEPLPSAVSSPVLARSTMPPDSVPARQAWARLEGALVIGGHGESDSWASAWGGMVRAALGAGRLVLVFGAAGFWPSGAELRGVRLREWRLPVDGGVRLTVARPRLVWYGEVGVVAALLNERAPDLLAGKSGTAFEIGGRLAAGMRLASRKNVVPFVAVSLDVIPDPPLVAALPKGIVGRTAYLWPAACLGVSWGPP